MILRGILSSKDAPSAVPADIVDVKISRAKGKELKLVEKTFNTLNQQLGLIRKFTDATSKQDMNICTKGIAWGFPAEVNYYPGRQIFSCKIMLPDQLTLPLDLRITKIDPDRRRLQRYKTDEKIPPLNRIFLIQSEEDLQEILTTVERELLTLEEISMRFSITNKEITCMIPLQALQNEKSLTGFCTQMISIIEEMLFSLKIQARGSEGDTTVKSILKNTSFFFPLNPSFRKKLFSHCLKSGISAEKILNLIKKDLPEAIMDDLLSCLSADPGRKECDFIAQRLSGRKQPVILEMIQALGKWGNHSHIPPLEEVKNHSAFPEVVTAAESASSLIKARLYNAPLKGGLSLTDSAKTAGGLSISHVQGGELEINSTPKK